MIEIETPQKSSKEILTSLENDFGPSHKNFAIFITRAFGRSQGDSEKLIEILEVELSKPGRVVTGLDTLITNTDWAFVLDEDGIVIVEETKRPEIVTKNLDYLNSLYQLTHTLHREFSVRSGGEISTSDHIIKQVLFGQITNVAERISKKQ